MSDPLVITAIIASVGSLLLSMMTHIKYSECWGAKILMKRNSPSTPNAPYTGIFTAPTETSPMISQPIPVPINSIAPVVKNSMSPKPSFI